MLTLILCVFRWAKKSHPEWRRVHTFMHHQFEGTFLLSYYCLASAPGHSQFFNVVWATLEWPGDEAINYLWQSFKLVDSSATNTMYRHIGFVKTSSYSTFDSYQHVRHIIPTCTLLIILLFTRIDFVFAYIVYIIIIILLYISKRF